MRHALAPALLLAGLASAFPPVPTDGHDLRGSGVPKGTVLLLEEAGKLADGTMTVDIGGNAQTNRISSVSAKKQRLEVLAVEGRRAVKYRVAWPRHEQTLKLDDADVEKTNPLSGRAALFEWKAGAWSSAVEKPKADDPPTLLALAHPWAADEGLYPSRRVAVGASWDVPEAALRAYYKEAARLDLSRGKSRGTFQALETVDGERCAVIAFTTTFSGKVEADGVGMEMEVVNRTVVRRSLRTGLNLRVKSESDTKTTLSGPVTGKLSGKESSETTLRVEKTP